MELFTGFLMTYSSQISQKINKKWEECQIYEEKIVHEGVATVRN